MSLRPSERFSGQIAWAPGCLLVSPSMPRTAKPAPAPAVPYFRPEALTFLRNLARHNDRAWFQPRKAQFEAELREPMLAIVRKITDAMVDFAPNHVRPAEKSLFRIYRDTRFSSDKRPYKTHVAAWWTHHGTREDLGRGLLLSREREGSDHRRRLLHAGEGSARRNPPLAARSPRGISGNCSKTAESAQALRRVRRQRAHAPAQGLPVRASGDGSDPLPAMGTGSETAREGRAQKRYRRRA